MSTRHLVAALPLLVTLAVAAPASAQTLLGRTTGYVVQRRVSYLGTVDEQTGLWFGAEGSVRLGRVMVGASGLFGSLTSATDELSMPDLSMRVSNLWVGTGLTSWLDVAAVVEARRHESDVGVTAWRLIGPQVRVAPPLGLGGLTVSGELTYFASASVIGGAERLSPAIRASVGMSLAPPRMPVAFRVSYRFERFDFGAVGTDPARLEQFSGLLAEIDIPLGKRGRTVR